MVAFLILDLVVVCWLLYSRTQERAPRRFDWKGVLAVCMGFWCLLVVLNVSPPLVATLGLILVFAPFLALFRAGAVDPFLPSPAGVVGIAAVLNRGDRGVSLARTSEDASCCRRPRDL